jgi:phosphohistidine phosphatase SixA
VERRPERPTRRALALGLTALPVLGPIVRAATDPTGTPAPRPAQKPAEKKRLLATVVLLRHAEKDSSGDSLNPGLSEAGKKRALVLAHLLSKARVTHLFASKYRRARETLQPFAERSGLKVDTDQGGIAADLAPRVLDLPAGSVAVVVGHSNTIPALASALGRDIENLETTPQGPMISDNDYGRLFVLTPAPEAGQKPLLLELAYGD